MPDPRVSKVEMTIPISENDLLRTLFSRYGKEELAKIGIWPESSVVRGFRISEEGVCEFRVCSVSVANVPSLLETLEISESRCSGCTEGLPGDDDDSIRIRKSTAGS